MMHVAILARVCVYQQHLFKLPQGAGKKAVRYLHGVFGTSCRKRHRSAQELPTGFALSGHRKFVFYQMIFKRVIISYL
jgi:hypothetical protein